MPLLQYLHSDLLSLRLLCRIGVHCRNSCLVAAHPISTFRHHLARGRRPMLDSLSISTIALDILRSSIASYDTSSKFIH